MHRIFILLLSFTLLFVGFNQTLIAQDLSALQDLQNMDVDKMSDAQISKLAARLESSGMSEEQLVQMAQARGMDEVQISKLRSKLLERQAQGKESDKAITGDRIRLNPLEQDQVDAIIAPLEMMAEQNEEDSLRVFDDGLEVFGLRYFREASLSFEPNFNIPTPEDYVLAPGDALYIDVWGASEQSYDLKISPEGSVRVPGIGPIYLAGLKITDAKNRIISKLRKIYGSIGSASQAEVSLGKIRTIKVHVIGEVHLPGTFQMTSFSSVFNALYSAGGPSKSGTMRQIEIYRQNKLHATFDAYKFLLEGSGNELTLKDQDIVIVKPFENRIRLMGEVKKPAAYELLDNETLDDLLAFAGGYTKDAYQGVVNVQRYEGNYLTARSITAENRESFTFTDGDEIIIPKITNQYQNRVVLEGPVLNPGAYELTEGLTLSGLIKISDGLRGDVFLKRGVIIRQNDDFTLSSLPFSPQNILSGDEDVLLKNRDLIRFHSIHDIREARTLKIEGEVLVPGTFDYADDMTVEDLIFLANGFKESAAKSFVEVARRSSADSARDINNAAQIFNFDISEDLSLSETASQFMLEPFDLVIVRKNPFFQKQELVELEGEIMLPGKYALETKDERISSLVKRAGGLSPYAFTDGATLIRRTEYFQEKSSLIYDEDGEIIGGAKIAKAAEIRKEDLTYRFSKEGLLVSDSTETGLFRNQESIGINLTKILESPGSKYDLILREGDVLSIPRQYQTVRVRGEVLYPSNIRFDNSSGFKRYISSSGGFDQLAKKNKSYIIYANGSAAQTRSFLGFKNYPKVEPGAEIVVPKRPERQPMNPQQWVGIAASILGLITTVQLLTQQ